jgi:putative toxin-antitoxin system antitoxin component (TIGR02293 family)
MRAVIRLINAGWLSKGEFINIIMPSETTGKRRFANIETNRLDPMESDRLVRMGRIIVEANEIFGDREKAMRWLHKPNRALKDHTPLEMSKTDPGARMVETLLGRISYGIFT